MEGRVIIGLMAAWRFRCNVVSPFCGLLGSSGKSLLPGGGGETRFVGDIGDNGVSGESGFLETI